MYESDSDMVGLTGTSVDLKLEEYTRTAEAFPPHNSICGYCTQPGEKATYIKYANHKVIREGKPMCLDCFNRINDERLAIKQFMKKSADEHAQAMDGLSEGSVRLNRRAATNPIVSQEEVDEGLAKLSKKEEETLKASTDYLAQVANGMEGWYVCRKEASLKDANITRVQDRGTGKWRNPTVEEVDVLKADLNCSNLIVPMNHWFRG